MSGLRPRLYLPAMRIPFNRALGATMGATLIAALVLGGVTLDRRLVAELEEDARADLSATPPLLVDRQATQGEMLRMHAMQVAGSEEVIDALAAGDMQRAVSAATSMAETWSEEAVVVDADGRVLSGPGGAGAITPASTLEAGPFTVVGGDGTLHGFALAEVRRGATMVGAAGVAKALDATTAEQLAGLTLADVVLVDASGRIVASTVDSAVARALASSEVATDPDGVREVLVSDAGRFWTTEAALGAAGRALFVRSVDRELAALPGLRGAALLAAGITLLVTLLVAGIVARSFARPVRALADASHQLASGDFDAPLPASRVDEIETVSQAFADMRASLERRLRELAEANEELADRQERLQALQSELVQRDRLAAAGRLVTELAHEIRNPVANVRNSLEVVKRHIDDEKAKRFTDLAIDELLRMHELAERILDLNRPSDGPAGDTDVDGVVRDVTALAEIGDRDGRWPIEVVGTSGVAAPIHADALKQVLLTLVTNAQESMPEGGEIEIRMGTANGESGLGLSVSDRGPGFAEDVLPHVFDPFFTTKEAVHGVGLGLFIAEGLVRTAGGRISAENRADPPGAIVRVHIPAGGRQTGGADGGEETEGDGPR
ncbi:MAG: HAMP domain-containing sensor histidine kinase [Gemmatimonadota bacterium]|nr:HAMP domain-containing sensor histidine kinase [Gemmatimonadota bacterium]